MSKSLSPPIHLGNGKCGPLKESHVSSVAQIDPVTGYISNIDDIRREEYPQLQGTTYLDHAGTTPYARSLVTAVSEDLTTNLFGNPHSASSSSQLSQTRIDSVRTRTLHFLSADPNHFDLVFVSSATAAIKLVAEAFSDFPRGFSYFYHVDSHTSLVGVRELATIDHRCLTNDDLVDEWLSALKHSCAPACAEPPSVFAYPGQSNLSGHRLTREWCSKIQHLRKYHRRNVYSLYDAAALLSTAEVDLSNELHAPDFTVLSFYKVFGLPDLGALIIRKECSDVFKHRKYFGGGTVDMVIPFESYWHARKISSLHSSLEDGTVPFHNVIAVGWALSTHARLFGSMYNVSRHTSFLVQRVYDKLKALRHSTGVRACRLYTPHAPDFTRSQGPTIAFNLRDARGDWVGKSEVEKLASVQGIQLRTGSLCNPGGTAAHLGLSATELKANFAAGQKCGDDNDILNGKPTGVIRVSFGAMSSLTDADKLIAFISEFFVQGCGIAQSPPSNSPSIPTAASFYVQSLSVYPIKSCAAFGIPPGQCWELRDDGLAWDREWCLIHQGTGVALNQKRYPQLTLIRPSIDLQRRVLVVTFDAETLTIGLDFDAGPDCVVETDGAPLVQSATVCGASQQVELYTFKEIVNFFTAAAGVPCTLARRQRAAPIGPIRSISSGPDDMTSLMPGYFPEMTLEGQPQQILFTNESPILLVSQSSVSSLERSIQLNDPTAQLLTVDSFRANIVVVQRVGEMELPYVEDEWTHLQIEHGEQEDTLVVHDFVVTGPCQRCQMVCVDQQSAKRGPEPYSTLAKTRRRNGKVWFGMHLSPAAMGRRDWEVEKQGPERWVQVGDIVRPQKRSI